MTAWFEGSALAFDVESTGLNIEVDRIATAAVVRLGADRPMRDHHVINPGVPMPPNATAINGLTDEFLKTHGSKPPEVLDVVAADLALGLRSGLPVIGMNLQFDLTLLDRECARHGVPTLSERLDGRVRPVVDVYVIDRHVSSRLERRNLARLCAHYGVRHHGEHDSAYDALAAALIAQAIMRRYPQIAAMNLDELHDAQQQWHAEQQESRRAYLASQGVVEVCDPRWPVIPAVSS